MLQEMDGGPEVARAWTRGSLRPGGEPTRTSPDIPSSGSAPGSEGFAGVQPYLLDYAADLIAELHAQEPRASIGRPGPHQQGGLLPHRGPPADAGSRQRGGRDPADRRGAGERPPGPSSPGRPPGGSPGPLPRGPDPGGGGGGLHQLPGWSRGQPTGPPNPGPAPPGRVRGHPGRLGQGAGALLRRSGTGQAASAGGAGVPVGWGADPQARRLRAPWWRQKRWRTPREPRSGS